MRVIVANEFNFFGGLVYFFYFIGLLYSVVIIHITSMLLAGLIYRCAIEEVGFGFGNQLFRVPLKRFALTVNMLPLGGYVRFIDQDSVGYHSNQYSGLNLLENLGFYSKTVIILSGCIVLMALACVLNGTKVIFYGFYIWEQYFSGALSPFSRAQDLINEAINYMKVATSLELFGLLCAKLSAINLLPIGFMNGGQVILELSKTFKVRDLTEKFMMLTFFIMLASYISWIIALGYSAYS